MKLIKKLKTLEVSLFGDGSNKGQIQEFFDAIIKINEKFDIFTKNITFDNGNFYINGKTFNQIFSDEFKGLGLNVDAFKEMVDNLKNLVIFIVQMTYFLIMINLIK